jgi:hypothetical protein
MIEQVFTRIHPDNYQGKLFIEVDTLAIIHNHFAIAYLDHSSPSCSNHLEFPCTRWEMFHYMAAWAAISLLYKSNYPFKVIGENNLLLYESQNDQEHDAN